MPAVPKSVPQAKDWESNLVLKLKDSYRIAYEFCAPHWVRAQRLLNTYENIIDKRNWPTFSEIPIPLFFMTVEQALPFQMDYLFPDEPFIELTPKSPDIDYERVRNVEGLLEDIIKHNMRLKYKGLPTIKDALKMGGGYGYVEAVSTTPVSQVLKQATIDGIPVVTSYDMEAGNRQMTVDYRYLSMGQVLPIGDGHDIDSTSVVFMVDFINENALREMYERDAELPEDQRVMRGNVDEIVRKARTGKLDANLMPSYAIIARLAGKQMVQADRQNKSLKNVPAIIPVVKAFYDREHYWLANGEDLIFQYESDYQLKKPIVYAKPWPDSDKFFTTGIPGITEDLNMGVNVFYNAVMDIMQGYLHPTRIINTELLQNPNNIPEHEPYGVIRVYGDPGKVVSYPEPPPLPGGMMGLGDIMQDFFFQATGQPRAMQGNASAGVVRGGLGAFESLLQTPLGREKLVGAILEMGWLDEVVGRVISLSQSLIGDSGASFMQRNMDEGKNVTYNEIEVTQRDLRQSYDFKINLRAKMRNSLSELGMRQALYDRLRQDPTVSKDSLREYLIGDRALARRLKATPAEVEQNLEQMRMQMEAESNVSPGVGEQAQAGRELGGR